MVVLPAIALTLQALFCFERKSTAFYNKTTIGKKIKPCVIQITFWCTAQESNYRTGCDICLYILILDVSFINDNASVANTDSHSQNRLYLQISVRHGFTCGMLDGGSLLLRQW